MSTAVDSEWTPKQETYILKSISTVDGTAQFRVKDSSKGNASIVRHTRDSIEMR